MELIGGLLTGGVLVALINWWLGRHESDARLSRDVAGVAQTAWREIKEMTVRIEELEEFRDIAIPVLRKCADGDPALAKEMFALGLLNGGRAVQQREVG